MEHAICGSLPRDCAQTGRRGGGDETENNADSSVLSPIVSFITSVPRTIGEAVTADRTGRDGTRLQRESAPRQEARDCEAALEPHENRVCGESV